MFFFFVRNLFGKPLISLTGHPETTRVLVTPFGHTDQTVTPIASSYSPVCQTRNKQHCSFSHAKPWTVGERVTRNKFGSHCFSAEEAKAHLIFLKQKSLTREESALLAKGKSPGDPRCRQQNLQNTNNWKWRRTQLSHTKLQFHVSITFHQFHHCWRRAIYLFICILMLWTFDPQQVTGFFQSIQNCISDKTASSLKFCINHTQVQRCCGGQTRVMTICCEWQQNLTGVHSRCEITQHESFFRKWRTVAFRVLSFSLETTWLKVLVQSEPASRSPSFAAMCSQTKSCLCVFFGNVRKCGSEKVRRSDFSSLMVCPKHFTDHLDTLGSHIDHIPKHLLVSGVEGSGHLCPLSNIEPVSSSHPRTNNKRLHASDHMRKNIFLVTGGNISLTDVWQLVHLGNLPSDLTSFQEDLSPPPHYNRRFPMICFRLAHSGSIWWESQMHHPQATKRNFLAHTLAASWFFFKQILISLVSFSPLFIAWGLKRTIQNIFQSFGAQSSKWQIQNFQTCMSFCFALWSWKWAIYLVRVILMIFVRQIGRAFAEGGWNWKFDFGWWGHQNVFTIMLHIWHGGQKLCELHIIQMALTNIQCWFGRGGGGRKIKRGF